MKFSVKELKRTDKIIERSIKNNDIKKLARLTAMLQVEALDKENKLVAFCEVLMQVMPREQVDKIAIEAINRAMQKSLGVQRLLGKAEEMTDDDRKYSDEVSEFVNKWMMSEVDNA